MASPVPLPLARPFSVAPLIPRHVPHRRAPPLGEPLFARDCPPRVPINRPFSPHSPPLRFLVQYYSHVRRRHRDGFRLSQPNAYSSRETARILLGTFHRNGLVYGWSTGSLVARPKTGELGAGFSTIGYHLTEDEPCIPMQVCLCEKWSSLTGRCRITFWQFEQALSSPMSCRQGSS